MNISKEDSKFLSDYFWLKGLHNRIHIVDQIRFYMDNSCDFTSVEELILYYYIII